MEKGLKPNLNGRHKEKLTGFRLNETHTDILKKIAKKNRMNHTEVVRWAIETLAETRFPDIFKEFQEKSEKPLDKVE